VTRGFSEARSPWSASEVRSGQSQDKSRLCERHRRRTSSMSVSRRRFGDVDAVAANRGGCVIGYGQSPQRVITTDSWRPVPGRQRSSDTDRRLARTAGTQRGDTMRRTFVAALLCSASVLGVSAGSAFAGEATGTIDDPNPEQAGTDTDWQVLRSAPRPVHLPAGGWRQSGRIPREWTGHYANATLWGWSDGRTRSWASSAQHRP
jgi:hypothetical protein